MIQNYVYLKKIKNSTDNIISCTKNKVLFCFYNNEYYIILYRPT